MALGGQATVADIAKCITSTQNMSEKNLMKRVQDVLKVGRAIST